MCKKTRECGENRIDVLKQLIESKKERDDRKQTILEMEEIIDTNQQKNED